MDIASSAGDYIQITIALPDLPPHETSRLVEEFNRFFPATDIYLQVNDQEMIIHLKQISYGSLENYVRQQNDAVSNAVFSRISRIKSYNIRGAKRIYAHYDAERKVKQRKQKEKNREKIYYTKDHSFSDTNAEPPPELTNAIICADSLEVLRKLPDNCVDLIFTSPPYNFGLEYEKQDDDHYWQHYFEKLFAIFSECIRVLAYGGRIIVNVQPLFSDYIPTHHIISNFFIQNKLLWKGEILWEKNNYNCKYTSWGSWKSPSSPYLKYTWEFLEVFCKGSLKKSGNPETADITGDEFKEWVTVKWSIAPERKMKDFDHPAMFPEELAKRIIKLFSFQGDFILDPFNGVGTTTAVAKKLARRFLGIDIVDRYCEVAMKRLEQSDM